jgi:hypothetical protein
MTRDPHRRARDEIAAHFAGAGSPAREQEMRAHLPQCASCHQHYEQHLLLASLDPAALSTEARLARGLGLRPGRRPGRMAFGLAGVCAAAFAALVLVPTLTSHGLRPGAASDPGAGVVARGGPQASAAARTPEVQIFRIHAGKTGAGTGAGAVPGGAVLERAVESVRRDDELAFLYRNPGGQARLLVFAVDEHGHIYWYHPGWSDAGENPTAVPISSEPGLHELPASVLHNFDGEHIMIHALFTDRELTVRQVEAAGAAAATSHRASGPGSPLLLPGAVDVVQPLRVLR